jgi:phosphatidylinositol 3,5-bisphosphate 5-phosphatase
MGLQQQPFCLTKYITHFVTFLDRLAKSTTTLLFYCAQPQFNHFIMNLPKIVPPLSQISIYETKGFLLLCGYSVSSCTYNMLEITRPALSASTDTLSFKPHSQEYTASQMVSRLKQMKSVYKDLELMQSDVECVYGIVKLLHSHYLIVVTKKRLVGSIVGHSIYTIENVSYIPVTYKLRVSAEEPRYKSLLTSFDLTKHIHFSYTYDLSRSWQQQVSQKDSISSSELNRIDTQNMFTWNSFALQPFLQFNKNDMTLDAWVMPVVYGYFRQKNMRFNDDLTLGFALIARRSRHFAGTRYLRRGEAAVLCFSSLFALA